MLGQNLKNHEVENKIVYKLFSMGWIISKGSTISISVGIVIFNAIIGITVTKMFEYRKIRDKSTMQIGIAVTSFKVQLLNSALCPLFGSFVAMNYLGKTGLVTQINAIFFANLVISNALSFFSFPWFMKKFQQYLFKKALKNDNKQNIGEYTQGEINELFEREEFDIPTRFASFFRNLSLAMLFLPILPMGVFYSIMAIFIEYWIVKWIILRRSTSKIIISNDLGNKMTDEFEFCLFIFAIGQAIKELIVEILNSQPLWIEFNTSL